MSLHKHVFEVVLSWEVWADKAPSESALLDLEA